ncbi:uncharacterized protein [Triticum aestivum]|uniref:uncharacterized protein n=1 Tax=Triticum aestivum TaxID=4565 RepID=UPI001D02A3B3|nr:uncharacterized protein LOC123119356 [Triticum aestivum]
MGQLHLMQPERQIQIRGGSTSSLAIRNGPPCQEDDDNYHDGKIREYSGTVLPEDIWCHIHSLMTPRDAARAACVSRAFRRSWRCYYPNLIFNSKTIGLSRDGMYFTRKVDQVLEKHSGIGVKTFEIDCSCCDKLKGYEYLHRWLQKVVTPGIEKLTLVMPENEPVNFPCPVLSNGNGSSIWAPFRVPSSQLCCVGAVETQEMLPDNLPKDTFPAAATQLPAGDRVEFLLGESLRLKKLDVLCYPFLRYALDELPSIAPNLETLSIYSWVVNTTLTLSPSKFLYLKYLSIYINGSCDCLSLVYFLGAAPSLETFKLRVPIQLQQSIEELLSEDPSHLRQIPGYRHDKLRRVSICRFPCSKSVVELTSHILENSASLECLTLSTTNDSFRCSDDRSAKCSCLIRPMEAHKAALLIERYIRGKVPSTVQLDVVEPCTQPSP